MFARFGCGRTILWTPASSACSSLPVFGRKVVELIGTPVSFCTMSRKSVQLASSTVVGRRRDERGGRRLEIALAPLLLTPRDSIMEFPHGSLLAGGKKLPETPACVASPEVVMGAATVVDVPMTFQSDRSSSSRASFRIWELSRPMWSISIPAKPGCVEQPISACCAADPYCILRATSCPSCDEGRWPTSQLLQLVIIPASSCNSTLVGDATLELMPELRFPAAVLVLFRNFESPILSFWSLALSSSSWSLLYARSSLLPSFLPSYVYVLFIAISSKTQRLSGPLWSLRSSQY